MTSKMKSLSRFSTLLSRSKSVSAPPNSSTSIVPAPNFDNAPADSPEASVQRNIKLFCESGSMSNGGEEVLHLPVIVDTAESLPSAAAAAAQQIRKFLSREWATKPHVQYNAIMLVRILCDNPGPSFTRNFDKAFVSTVKEALRNCKDPSTQQILRETLDNLEANKQYQEGLEGLIQMWRKEKGQSARLSQGYGTRGQAVPGLGAPSDYQYRHPPSTTHHGGEQQRSSSGRRQLPPPIELASRIEEARNTAKILLQLIQSTPSEEVLNNDLIREFADRCQSAQKSMQGYINCDSPPPDDDTMLTLIETTEQLSLASTRYQRSVLNARKALGVSPSPNADTALNNTSGPYAPPSIPPTQGESLFASGSPPRQATQPFAFRNPSDSDSYQPPPGPPRQSQQPSRYAYPNETYEPPPGPPRQMSPQNTFTSRNESYPPPSGPPRHATSQNAYSRSQDDSHRPPAAPPRQMSQQGTITDRDNSYQPPPGPPPAMLARLNSREGQSPNLSDTTYLPPNGPPPRSPRRHEHQSSDPFADPVEHDRNAAPYAVISSNYSTAGSNPANRPHSQTFNIDAEPAYAPPQNRSNVTSENAYDQRPLMAPPRVQQPSSAVSPSLPSDGFGSSLPAPGDYRDSDTTASYTDRLTNPANGVTVQGASRDQYVSEIDGHSEVGRIDESRIDRQNTTASQGSSAYSVSPVETRTAHSGNHY